MILPIMAYGEPVLRKKAQPISPDYPKLAELVANMFETMYNAKGVGLAAPQVGLDIRLFVVDSQAMYAPDDDGEQWEDDPLTQLPVADSGVGIKQVFINPTVVERSGQSWSYNEGCLSIPNIREDVTRQERVRVQYVNENFELKDEVYEGYNARVILHEYDHIEGILFIDHISPLRKRIIKNRLDRISKGIVTVNYRMRFPLLKRR